jgi:hypothetical protein
VSICVCVCLSVPIEGLVYLFVFIFGFEDKKRTKAIERCRKTNSNFLKCKFIDEKVNCLRNIPTWKMVL